MLNNIESSSQVQRSSSLLARLNRAAVPFVFLCFIVLPIAWFNKASFAPVPLHENRVLEPFPKPSIRWLHKLEKWFSDRFGMRDALVYYGSRLQMARTGTPTNQNVVVGPNQWLFYDPFYMLGQPHFADLQGRDPFSVEQLQAITDNLKEAQEKLEACHIPFYFIVAPDKQTIYPEQLGIHVADGVTTRLDQLVEYLSTALPALKVIDLRPALKEARATAPYELYLRTDTHWNSLGAFYGYRAIVNRFVRDGVLPAAPLATLDAWTMDKSAYEGGDIAVSMASLPGYFEDFRTHVDKRTPRLGHWVMAPTAGPQGERATSASDTGNGRLLIYRDSFSGDLLPYLMEDFASIESYSGHDIDGAEIIRQKPTVVALEIIERNIRLLADSPPKRMNGLCGETSH